MEHWELIARGSIRDLVSRYNANADTGRFARRLVDIHGYAPTSIVPPEA